MRTTSFHPTSTVVKLFLTIFFLFDSMNGAMTWGAPERINNRLKKRYRFKLGRNLIIERGSVLSQVVNVLRHCCRVKNHPRF